MLVKTLCSILYFLTSHRNRHQPDIFFLFQYVAQGCTIGEATILNEKQMFKKMSLNIELNTKYVFFLLFYRIFQKMQRRLRVLLSGHNKCEREKTNYGMYLHFSICQCATPWHALPGARFLRMLSTATQF